MPKPDNAEDVAREAYQIYRGMKDSVNDMPHWDNLSRSERGLFEWVARYATLHNPPR